MKNPPITGSLSKEAYNTTTQIQKASSETNIVATTSLSEKTIKEIANNHSVRIYLDDAYNLFALLPMSQYPKEHNHETN